MSDTPNANRVGSAKPLSVTAVVVTYNRLDLLRGCLRALEDQTLRPDRIIVVDNASTDGTAAVIREQYPQVDLLQLGTNTGGAGGFTAGMARASQIGADLIWLMDDDTEPTPTALAESVAAWRSYPGTEPPAFVASAVAWTDGRAHPMNTPRRRPGVKGGQLRAAESTGCIPVRSASFVSLLVDSTAVREQGLPMADYFLWNDDFEFTTRLARDRAGLLCPSSLVIHRTARFGSTDADPGERFFYEVRNKLWLMRMSAGLRLSEKALFGGSTARRWVRTARGSSDRRALFKGFRRGLAEGLRTRPRSNADVLAPAGFKMEPRS